MIPESRGKEDPPRKLEQQLLHLMPELEARQEIQQMHPFTADC